MTARRALGVVVKVLVAMLAALAVAPAASAGVPSSTPSLTPAKTKALWRAEVKAAHTARRVATANCRSARVVFYAQTDWLRLATKLAQNPSACADYFVSVPPLAADKTQARPNQAAQIRALGARFHALDEISYAGWNGWVSAGNGSWYDAGGLARQRMAAAGFDTTAGDTWAMNELSSAVRKGTGAARRNALDFLHGLASDGVRGVAFTAGVGQPTPDLASYQVNLQDWLQDTSFWSEAAGYVSDWAQENYGDIRNYAVAATTVQQRRDALVQYLAHESALANAGPAATAAAFLARAYVPFGNAAWAWSSAYGWTAAPVASMEDFVSGQVYADRSYAAAAGASVDRLGFAWSPSNTLGLAAGDFDTQTAAVLDRIAAAIHDSDAPSADVGAAACAPSWCTTSLGGAAFTTAWAAFSTWAPTVPVFTTPAASATAGATMGPVTVELQTDGLADAATAPRTLTLSSSSTGGSFALAAAGPWSTALTLTIPQGGSAGSFYYVDSAQGTPAISALLDGGATTTQVETVAAAPPPSSTGGGGGGGPSPPSAPPPSPAPVTVPPPLVTTAPVAKPQPQPQPQPRILSVTRSFVSGHLVVRVRVGRGTAHPAGIRVRIHVRRGSSTVATVERRTLNGGVATWRSSKKLRPGGYAATARLR